jgi:hypothetical protein
LTFLFPRDLRGFCCLVVPHFVCTRWVHPLLRFFFSLEFVSVPSPLRMRTCSTPSVRFGSPSRHQSEESTCSEFPNSHLVPLSAFHTLSAVYSSSDLMDLFHSKATSKIRFPRAFPTIKPPQLVAASSPHCISEIHLLRSCPPSADFPRRTSKVLSLIAIRYNHRWG